MGKAKFTILEKKPEGGFEKVQSVTDRKYAEKVVEERKKINPEFVHKIIPYDWKRDTKPFLDKFRVLKHELVSSKPFTFEGGWSDIKGNFGKLLDSADILLEYSNVANLEELPPYTLKPLEGEVRSVLRDIENAIKKLEEALE